MSNIAIIDCGISNLTSVLHAFEFLKIPTQIVQRPEELKSFSHLVLPGVGAFPQGVENLRARGFFQAVPELVKSGKPILGICLGMQLLAELGEEFSLTPGLALIPGKVKKIPTQSAEIRLPHIGWNSVTVHSPSALWRGLEKDPTFYFLHSYAFADLPVELVAAHCEYGHSIIAAVERENVYGVQFHPEKSQKTGLKLLENFAKLC